MQHPNEKDNELARIMLKSKLPFPSADLESIVMSGIYAMKRARIVLKNRRLSFVFLAIEIVLGLFINFTLERFPVYIPRISPLTFLNFFQMGFLLIFFIQLENCLSLSLAEERRHDLF